VCCLFPYKFLIASLASYSVLQVYSFALVGSGVIPSSSAFSCHASSTFSLLWGGESRGGEDEEGGREGERREEGGEGEGGERAECL